jgi:hypothetical protein
MRDLQDLLWLPTAGLQLGQGGVEVGHPVHQDGMLAFDVVGQQQQRWARGELDGGDSGAHAFDREDYPAAQDLGEVAEVSGHISAWHVHEVELLERCCGVVGHGVV